MSHYYIIIFIIGALLIILVPILLLYGVHIAAKGPSDKDIIRTIESIIGVKIGRKYEIQNKEWSFAHSDSLLNCEVVLPEERFLCIYEECKAKGARERDGQIFFPQVTENTDYPERTQSVILDSRARLIKFHSAG